MRVQSHEVQTIKRDYRGTLGAFDFSNLPFSPKRAYWLTNFEGGIKRGGHAHKELIQYFVAIQGEVVLNLRNSTEETSIRLVPDGNGLIVYPGIWRELVAESSHSVLLVIASEEYDEGDYLRTYEDYLKWLNEVI